MPETTTPLTEPAPPTEPAKEEPRELLTVKETAQLLNVSKTALDQGRLGIGLAKSLPFVRLGRKILYRRTSSLTWLARVAPERTGEQEREGRLAA